MKKVIIILSVFLIGIIAVLLFNAATISKADTVLANTKYLLGDLDKPDDISTSAIHDNTIFIPTIEETTEYYVEEYYEEPETEWILSRETIIDYAYEVYGVSEEWTIWLIGTTWNEDYHDDRYLEYAWACEIINCYSDYSVWDLDCIWGTYYSISHAYEGYYAADYTCLEMVWEALTNTDTRIVEVDGMIDWDVPGYYLIYDSPYHNCQVWGG